MAGDFGRCPKCGGVCGPANGQQYAAHLSDSVEVLCTGGNRSGKSLWEVANAVFHITGRYPDWFPVELRRMPGLTDEKRAIRWRLLAPTYEKGINDVIWPIFLALLPRSMRVDPKRNSQGGFTLAGFPNGAELSFLTYSQPVKYAAGWHGDGASFDEPPDQKVYYTETLRGLLDLNGVSNLAMTPVRTIVWVDKMFTRLARSEKVYPRSGPYTTKPAHFKFDLDDNPTILDARKAHWRDRLDKDEIASRVTGETIAQQYLVLRQWDDRRHVAAPAVMKVLGGQTYIEDSAWATANEAGESGWAPVSLYMVLDPHDAKAQVITWHAVWPPGPDGVTCKKRTVAELADGTLSTIDEAAQAVKNIEQQIGIPKIRTIDPNFGPKRYGNTGRTVMQEWILSGQKIGWPLYFTPGKDAVEVGHNEVRRWLVSMAPDGSAEWAVCANCPSVIDAARYGSYTGNYDLDKKSPFKDWLDNLRYFALSRPRFWDPQEHNAPSDWEDSYVPDPEVGG